MDFRQQMESGRRKVAVLIAAVLALSVVVVSLERTDATPARAPLAGRFTGETTADGPVYRLPPLQVVADRQTGYAGIEYADPRVPARAAQARAAGHRPGV